MQQPQANFTVAEPKVLAYSIPGACKAAGVGRTKLYEALASGALRSRRNGAKHLILRADLERWLEALPTEKAPAPSPKSRLAPAA
jgi:excisionase family DNA binding protein